MIKEFLKGIWDENPILKMMLGLCPVLAVSTSVENAIGMGLATTFVLLSSNILVSLLRKIIPKKVRIPSFIIIIATFVTITDLVMNAYFPALHKSLGIFIPLIVVNCIILGRAEAFASKNGVILSILDALGMGIGFTIALSILAAVRELLGNATLLNFSVLPHSFHKAIVMILPPGAFITLGFMLIGMNLIDKYKKHN